MKSYMQTIIIQVLVKRKFGSRLIWRASLWIMLQWYSLKYEGAFDALVDLQETTTSFEETTTTSFERFVSSVDKGELTSIVWATLTSGGSITFEELALVV